MNDRQDIGNKTLQNRSGPNESIQQKPGLPMVSRMVAALNRMQHDEAFRKEIAKKIF